MKIRHWITGIILLGLIALVGMGVLHTRETGPAVADSEDGTPDARAAATPAPAKGGKGAGEMRGATVDQTPLLTARKMAALAGSPQEQALAHAAEKSGDHEVDLEFFDKLRAAEEVPPQLPPAVQQLADRKHKAEDALKDDQESITQLMRKLAAAPLAQKDNLQDQIDVAQAQVDSVQPEQVERTLDAMEMLSEFNQHVRTDSPNSKL